MNDNKLALIQSKQIMEEFEKSGCKTFYDYIEKKCYDNTQKDFQKCLDDIFKTYEQIHNSEISNRK